MYKHNCQQSEFHVKLYFSRPGLLMVICFTLSLIHSNQAIARRELRQSQSARSDGAREEDDEGWSGDGAGDDDDDSVGDDTLVQAATAGRACPTQSRLPFRNLYDWCYAYVDDPMPWIQARRYCERSGSRLAKVESGPVSGFLASLLVHDLHAWIGLSDRLKERRFIWTDGTQMTYSNWYRGEPNNMGNEDCVTVMLNGRWNDLACWRNKPFICQAHSVADCCSLDPPEGIVMDTNETTEGTTVHMKCAEGYYMKGSDMTRTCQPNEVWSGRMPHCYKKACGDPGDVASASRTGGMLFGQTMTYRCQSGFYLASGNATLLCGADGKWVGTKPTCKEGSEPKPAASRQTGQTGSMTAAGTWYIYVIALMALALVISLAASITLWRRRNVPLLFTASIDRRNSGTSNVTSVTVSET